MKKGQPYLASPHEQAVNEHFEWEWQFGQVVAFKQSHGHTNLGSHPAGEWLLRQQRLAEMGRLSHDRQSRLREAGIPLAGTLNQDQEKAGKVPDAAETSQWVQMLARLDTYQQQHGHCDVPAKLTGHTDLALWLRQQRLLYKEQRLPADRLAQLEALGAFNKSNKTPNEQLWQLRYEELAAYSRGHGHTNVTRTQNKVLGHWRDVQREFRRKGMLSLERISLLNGIGFEWESEQMRGQSQAEAHQRLWEEKLERLRAFQQRFGHCHVPVFWEEDRKLGGWVSAQRHRYREGKLEEARVSRLEELGFQWQVPYRFSQPPFITEKRPFKRHTERWEQRFEEMAVYAQKNGHTNVKVSENKVISFWRETQREYRRKSMLTAERISRLDGIGFEWGAPQMRGQNKAEANQRLWGEKLEHLRAFQQRFGHTQVHAHWPEDLKLATWVATQRHAKACGRLNAEKESQLNELGFDWMSVKQRMRIIREERNYPEKQNIQWEQRYADLTAFHAKHGHCLVPNKKPEVQALCKWCYAQRSLRRTGKLKPERVAKLDALNFRWDATEVPGLSYEERLDHLWEQSFTRLLAFHAKHGHSHVPVRWEEDEELGEWVYKQRHKARQGRLSAERRARLEALNFPWQPTNSVVLKPRPPQNIPKPAHEKAWERRLEELRAFQREHSHLHVPKKHLELSRWCKLQRRDARRGTLSVKRRVALLELGFEW